VTFTFILQLLVQALVSIFVGVLGAWLSAKFAAKRHEKIEADFLERITAATSSLSAIARRLPGGQAYAAVKQAERSLGDEQRSTQTSNDL
jgi:hypothetical protein